MTVKTFRCLHRSSSMETESCMYGDTSEGVLLLFCILKCDNVLDVIPGFRLFIYKEKRITVDMILK